MTLPSRTVPDLECQLNWDAVQALLPGAGEVRMWALPTAPTGWAVCDGSVCPDGELRRKLLAAGSPHGVSGALPLLPDMRGRVPMGVGTGSGLTARTLGAAYGGENLANADLPGHTHTGTTDTAGAHAHNPNVGGSYLGNGGAASANLSLGGGGYTTFGPTDTHPGHQHTFTTAVSSGTGTGTGSRIPPSRGMNFIIKT